MLRIPADLTPASTIRSLHIQDMTVVAYSQRQQQTRKEAFLTEHAINFILEGSKNIHTNEKDYQIAQETALFLPRGCYLMSDLIPDTGSYRSLMVFFNEKLVREFFELNQDLLKNVEGQTEHSLLTALPLTPALQGIAEAIIAYFDFKGNHFDKFLRLKFHELLLHLVADPAILKQLICIYQRNRVDLAYFMESHFNKSLSIDELARLSGRSTSAFKRECSQLFGMPPGQWIRNRSLTHAHFLLCNTNRNVSEIAWEVGFESISHFIKSYKEQFGFTPGSLKRAETLFTEPNPPRYF